jgi:cysteine desulfurase/selenocysteine lyase
MLEVKRSDFPLLESNKDLVYLDSAATSIKPQIVIDKINEYYTKYGVNIHRGVYDLSGIATNEYEELRSVVSKFINSKPEEVVYTKGTTDGINKLAYMLEDRINENDEIIVSVLDHHSLIMPWQNIALKKKAKLVFVYLNENNQITVENFKKCINQNTKIVALTHVSNVLGVISPVKEITKLAHEVGAIVVLDGAQSVPHMKVDVKDLDVDFLAFSGHKMMAPTGTGILYGKYKLLNSLNPTEFGGDMNDGVEKYSSTYKDAPEKFEAGTQNIEGVIAFKKAIEYLTNLGLDNVHEHSKKLALYVVEQIKDNPLVELYTKNPESGIVTFNIKDVHPHDVATFLSSYNICIRAGHHCAQLITHHLGCMGTVRASFYIYNTLEDAKKLVEAINAATDYFKEWLI